MKKANPYPLPYTLFIKCQHTNLVPKQITQTQDLDSNVLNSLYISNMKPSYKLNLRNKGLSTDPQRFPIGKNLFVAFPDSPIKTCVGEARVGVERASRGLKLSFQIDIQVEMICDRTLRPFEESLEIREILWVQWGDQTELIAPEVLLLAQHEENIDLRQSLYDFICLSLPIKRLHPDCRDEENPNEENIPVYSTENTKKKN
ncbi:MAG: DUF177 domain-containing protein [Cytophagales bacterium]|nr:DUF177 domain-containing protein [Cytophagales bacterium]